MCVWESDRNYCITFEDIKEEDAEVVSSISDKKRLSNLLFAMYFEASEGKLGIVVKVTLKLFPINKTKYVAKVKLNRKWLKAVKSYFTPTVVCILYTETLAIHLYPFEYKSYICLLL